MAKHSGIIVLATLIILCQCCVAAALSSEDEELSVSVCTDYLLNWSICDITDQSGDTCSDVNVNLYKIYGTEQRHYRSVQKTFIKSLATLPNSGSAVVNFSDDLTGTYRIAVEIG